jgi:hypothetical protein
MDSLVLPSACLVKYRDAQGVCAPIAMHAELKHWTKQKLQARPLAPTAASKLLALPGCSTKGTHVPMVGPPAASRMNSRIHTV